MRKKYSLGIGEGKVTAEVGGIAEVRLMKIRLAVLVPAVEKHRVKNKILGPRGQKRTWRSLSSLMFGLLIQMIMFVPIQMFKMNFLIIVDLLNMSPNPGPLEGGLHYHTYGNMYGNTYHSTINLRMKGKTSLTLFWKHFEMNANISDEPN